MDRSCFVCLLFSCVATVSVAQTVPGPNPSLERNGQYITIEPYAANVVRVTLSLDRAQAEGGPGFGFVASPVAGDWSHAVAANGADSYTSSRMTVSVSPGYKPDPQQKLPDTAKFFSGSTPGTNIRITLPDGRQLLDMEGWEQATLNQKDDTLKDARGILARDLPLYTVGATFASPDDEHYYGLGQNQEGYLDHRARPVTCAANYLAPASPTWCVPLVVTNKGYGLLWDNASSTTISPGFDGTTKWTSQLGKRVSFFVIAGNTTNEIYAGYRLLTGTTPMLPKAAYGFIQCKQRYRSQAEVLAVAKGYRDRHLPLDMIVVDWFYYTQMGQYDFDPELWPDPTAMNKELHAENVDSMISVWPRFASGSRYYDEILNHGWFEQFAAGQPATSDEPAPGTPVNGLPYDKAGSDIDTTNPEAARWWWSLIRNNIQAKGFDYFWADETEPDLPPDGAYLHAGPGAEVLNVYPLFHTGAIYDGVRRDNNGKRALVLARDAYTGTQRNGAMVWTSDISPTWDTLRRQVPTLLNDAASGMPYVGDDIGGWQYLPQQHTPAYPPLVSPEGARAVVGHNDDYPELYVRWFQFGTFMPTMRTHGTREANEVWSYGPAAQPILEKFLRLRYAMMPYLYSLGWETHQTGAPMMRALWMDFPQDERVLSGEVSISEYMFGPSLLVAPVLRQGQTTREVYLPAGADWFNYWTEKKLHGGQTVTVQAPIDQIPLFVRAGSILPVGKPVESTHEKQGLAQVKVYPGADASFTLYSDDGTTYGYEKGAFETTTLHWNNETGKFTVSGAKLAGGGVGSLVRVVGGGD